MKKILLLVIIICSIEQPLFAQPRFIPKFIRKMLFEKDSSKTSSFFVLPVLGSAPETGIEAGGSALYSFYTDTLNANTRVSNLFGYATLTTKGQTRISLSTSYWTPQNKYHYTANASYINFPFDYFGIGNETHKTDKNPLGQERIKLVATAEKRFGNHFYIGLRGGGFHYKFRNKLPGGIYETLLPTDMPRGGTAIMLGPTFIFDSRNNNTYTTKGAIVTSYLDLMKGLYGSKNYSGTFFNIEYAQFFSLSKRLVLGINIQEQSLLGSQKPFFLLPTLGNDEIMRGYYNGRFRDQNLLAGQTELRYRLSDRLGIVGFVGAGQVFGNSFKFSSFKPSFGAGGRYFFDVEKGLSMRVDYAFGEQRPGESRQNGLYLSLSEAF